MPPLIETLLEKHEGYRRHPYQCPAGYLTIGIGRNLEAIGIRRHEALYLLREDIREFTSGIRERFPEFDTLDEIRRAVLVDMGFNLGIAGLFQFRRMFDALRAGDWDQAAVEMLASRWAVQVGRRATELAGMMRRGEYDETET